MRFGSAIKCGQRSSASRFRHFTKKVLEQSQSTPHVPNQIALTYFTFLHEKQTCSGCYNLQH